MRTLLTPRKQLTGTVDWRAVVVQSLNHIRIFATPWTAAHQASLPSLSPGVCSDLCPLSRRCYLSHPLTPSSVAFNLSNELALHIKWPKYLSLSFSISPSNEYSELMSCSFDWFDLLAAHATLKSILQDHSLKTSVLQCLAFFMVHPSHPYMTTGKTIALTIQTFVDKVMPLLCNLLCRFVIAFLPRNKCLLILCLQSPSAVILGPKKIKSITTSWIAIKYAVVFLISHSCGMHLPRKIFHLFKYCTWLKYVP